MIKFDEQDITYISLLEQILNDSENTEVTFDNTSPVKLSQLFLTSSFKLEALLSLASQPYYCTIPMTYTIFNDDSYTRHFQTFEIKIGKFQRKIQILVSTTNPVTLKDFFTLLCNDILGNNPTTTTGIANNYITISMAYIDITNITVSTATELSPEILITNNQTTALPTITEYIPTYIKITLAKSITKITCNINGDLFTCSNPNFIFTDITNPKAFSSNITTLNALKQQIPIYNIRTDQIEEMSNKVTDNKTTISENLEKYNESLDLMKEADNKYSIRNFIILASIFVGIVFVIFLISAKNTFIPGEKIADSNLNNEPSKPSKLQQYWAEDDVNKHIPYSA